MIFLSVCFIQRRAHAAVLLRRRKSLFSQWRHTLRKITTQLAQEPAQVAHWMLRPGGSAGGAVEVRALKLYANISEAVYLHLRPPSYHQNGKTFRKKSIPFPFLFDSFLKKSSEFFFRKFIANYLFKKTPEKYILGVSLYELCSSSRFFL